VGLDSTALELEVSRDIFISLDTSFLLLMFFNLCASVVGDMTEDFIAPIELVRSFDVLFSVIVKF